MTHSTHLALPYLDAAQAQKHVTHNEALQRLDALVHLSVSARNASQPPASPAEGDRILVGAGATGAFANQDFQIATFLAGAWAFLRPRAGWRVFVEAETLSLVYDGANWIDLGLALRVVQNLNGLGVGAATTPGNPFTAKVNSALFTAKAPAESGSGDLRLSLNKTATGNTASLIYQTAYSGRAEAGLAGDDRYHVKVSADGASWKEALIVNPSTAAVTMPFTSVAPFDAMAYQGLQINGGMEVSQMNGLAATTKPNGYVIDGWQVYASNSLAVSAQQVADAPPGFQRSLQVSVSSAQASLASGDYVVIQQPIEGYRSARLGLGRAFASAFTVSFFFKSSTPGAYYVGVRNSAANRSHVRKFSYSSANVWQWATLVFPGDTIGDWLVDASSGLNVSICLATGSMFRGTPNSWQATNLLSGPDQTNGAAAANNFQLAGFFVFPDAQAPGSADAWKCQRHFDAELQSCKRYLQILRSAFASGSLGNGLVGSATTVWGIKVPLAQSMRAPPTVSQSSCSVNDGGGWRLVSSLTNFSSPDLVCFDAVASSGLTPGRAAIFGDSGSNAAALTIDARL